MERGEQADFPPVRATSATVVGGAVRGGIAYGPPIAIHVTEG